MEQKSAGLKRYSHKVGVNFWHFVFVTKYRYKMFGKFKQQKMIEACIRRMAAKHGIIIDELKAMPDHAHMLISLPHNMTDSRALQLLKGGSAFLFFRNHPKSRLRLPRGNLWSAGGCATTVGYTEYNTIKNYILTQEERTAKT